MPLVLNFKNVSLQDLPHVGGKNASLGEMMTQLSVLGVQVPCGFATTAQAYRTFLQENQLNEKIYQLLDQLNVDDLENLRKTSGQIQQWIVRAELSEKFKQQVKAAYETLCLSDQQTVAVRSSATAEDLPEASFAGQQETFLNVGGIEAVLEAIKKVYASLFTERAIVYRVHHGFKHRDVAISAGVQQMIRSDLAASGVAFTLDTESGFDQVIFITSSYGLGEAIVQGAVNPDEFYVHKPTLEAGKRSIVSRKLGSKEEKMIYTGSGKQGIQTCKVAEKDQQRFSLSDDDIIQLARQILLIEKHYKKAMDIEWAKDGVDNKIYIIQARPETVKSVVKSPVLEHYVLKEKVKPLVSGRSVGHKIGKGIARLIKDSQQMDALKKGEVLVAEMTDPDWEPVMKRAAAIVTDRGGRTCHAAIVAREMGIPAVVGCGDAMQILSSGDEVTVSCAEGETGFVYPGLLDYDVDKTALETLPEIPVKLCMNLANPEQAFKYQFLPNHGVGLARLEFIIGNMIGIHPEAILQLETLPKTMQEDILRRTSAYASPVEYYIEKMAEGIATIAAAFYPKSVIVRFSDFKSNEYAHLFGGESFEPKEENPMLGYRGGSRYISTDFKDCFAFECEAIKRVRDQKGLTNVHVMFPFVRTVDELCQLIKTTKSNGLMRGQAGLNIYMMCEIPSNVLLAEEFLQYVDGYSIGSNDLTQLTLGVDRDSERVAHLFDERDAAVKALLHRVISVCKKMDKYVGICGQGPSDHLDFAQWLISEGVGTLSLSPDSIVPTWLALKV